MQTRFYFFNHFLDVFSVIFQFPQAIFLFILLLLFSNFIFPNLVCIFSSSSSIFTVKLSNFYSKFYQFYNQIYQIFYFIFQCLFGFSSTSKTNILSFCQCVFRFYICFLTEQSISLFSLVSPSQYLSNQRLFSSKFIAYLYFMYISFFALLY